jgi:SpoVK/Ycf46/Vps4 family AAA+-type ATPase
MNANELIKQMLLSFNSGDRDAFINSVQAYIEHDKRMKHAQVAKELEKVLYERPSDFKPHSERRFINAIPVPRDSEKGFPLLEIHNCDEVIDNLIITGELKIQLEQIIREFKDAEVLASYGLSYKKKVLLCGKPGTGKTFTTKVISSMLNIPLVYIRFDSIISSYLGETASNLRRVFDYIEQGMWVVLFDEFDIIGKNRDDVHEHGEIKRVVNNFLQMLDTYKGTSILFAATNHQHLLDSAIWRRFDDVLYYELPDTEARIKLFERYIKPLKRQENIDLLKVSEKTEGVSHADIKMIAEEALKLSIINERNILDNEMLMLAIDKFLQRDAVRNICKRGNNE